MNSQLPLNEEYNQILINKPNQHQKSQSKRFSHLMEIILGDAAVFNVKNAFERLHIKQVDLLQVLQLQRDAAQLFPHQGGQVQVQGLLGADGHAHQDAQELELEHVLVHARRRVEEEPAQIRTEQTQV